MKILDRQQHSREYQYDFHKNAISVQCISKRLLFFRYLVPNPSPYWLRSPCPRYCFRGAFIQMNTFADIVDDKGTESILAVNRDCILSWIEKRYEKFPVVARINLGEGVGDALLQPFYPSSLW